MNHMQIVNRVCIAWGIIVGNQKERSVMKIKDNGRTTYDGKTYKRVKRYFRPFDLYLCDWRETIPSRLARFWKANTALCVTVMLVAFWLIAFIICVIISGGTRV